MVSKSQPYEDASWQEIAEYVAAGSILSVDIKDDLETVGLTIGYANWRDGTNVQGRFLVLCLRSRYWTVLRREDHEPGSSIIIESHLHSDSTLIADFRAYKLDGITAPMPYPTPRTNLVIYHLEIAGEINVNILFEEIKCLAVWPTVVPAEL